MKDCLSSIFTAAVNNTIPVRQAFCSSNFRNNLKNPGNICRIIGIDLICTGYMFFRNNKYMNRCLWIDIAEGIDLLILIYFSAWDFSRYDFAEKAIIHCIKSSLLQMFQERRESRPILPDRFRRPWQNPLSRRLYRPL